MSIYLHSAEAYYPTVFHLYRYDNLTKEVRICLVGKYTKIGEDAYSSVVKSLWHSCLQVGRRLALSFVEATDIEPAMLQTDPEKYHKAWSNLVTCQCVTLWETLH